MASAADAVRGGGGLGGGVACQIDWAKIDHVIRPDKHTHTF